MFVRVALVGAALLSAVMSCSSDDDADDLFGPAGGTSAGAGNAGAGGRNGLGGAQGGSTVGRGGESGMGPGGLGGESGSDPAGSGGEGAVATGGSAAGGSGGRGGRSAGGGSAGSAATGGTSGAGGTGGATELCGGIACEAGRVCCGPPECGYCIDPGTDPACASSCSRRSCGDDGLQCLNRSLGFPGELCVEVEISRGPSSSLSWECLRNPCGNEPVSCDCARQLCAKVDPIAECSGPGSGENQLRCFGGGPCNSPDTPIATPGGERAIATLEPGDLVYSAHDGALSAVPLRRVARTPVHGHEVVRLTLQSGVVLEISAGHPTADGRTFQELATGGTLDGMRILARELVPYRHPFTYDILPSSDTGTYVAGGVLIGSTLARESRWCVQAN